MSWSYIPNIDNKYSVIYYYNINKILITYVMIT